MGRRLVGTVPIHQKDGTVAWYGPDDDVPADVAKKIGDHAWVEDDADEAKAPAKKSTPAKKAAAKKAAPAKKGADKPADERAGSSDGDGSDGGADSDKPAE